MHKESTSGPIFDFKSIKFCVRGDFVGRPDRRVRFQNAEAIVKLYIERVFPTDVAHVFKR